VIDFLKLFYTGKPKPEAWQKTVGLTAEQIDQQYPRFIRIEPGQVDRDLIAPAAIGELALPEGELNEKDIARLGDCTDLRWLDLSNAKIEAEVVKSLTGCQKLGELDLSGLKLSAEDFQALGELKALKILSLAGVEISEENFQALAELESLEQLDLTGSQISQEWLSRLSQTRPKLKIVK
jgi:Leucine-rich repeat (LRR) protein